MEGKEGVPVRKPYLEGRPLGRGEREKFSIKKKEQHLLSRIKVVEIRGGGGRVTECTQRKKNVHLRQSQIVTACHKE